MPFDLSSRLRGSISVRIAFLFSLTFTVGLALAFLATYIQVRNSLESSSKEVISAKLQESAVVLEKDGIDALRDFLTIDRNKVVGAPFMIRVLNGSGETIFLKPSVQEKEFDFDTAYKTGVPPSRLRGWRTLSAINDEDKFDILTEPVSRDLYLQVGKSSEDREEILSQIESVFGISGALLVLLSGGLGFLYAKRALAPIRHLIKTVQEIERGDLTRRVGVGSSGDELQDLGQTFNRMISRIEKLIVVMRESLDNVAHDIRTPLTRIRAVAEDALLGSNSDALRGALEDCAETSIEISELVDQLMSISEAEAGTLSLRLERCDVALLVHDVVEIYEFVAQEKGITISVLSSPTGQTWLLDRKRMKQAVANLLDNAIKFSPDNSSIQISVTIKEGRLVFAVNDEGPGIPASELGRIWDRLYRGDRSRTTKGLGLGLSIVRSVATAHGGEVYARTLERGGTGFSISLPELAG